jgi:hypothetical protein
MKLVELKLKEKKMKIGIIGSRNFNDNELLEEVMLDYLNREDEFNCELVVSGGAIGADRLGEQWAKNNNIPTLIFKPEWEKYGKSAGFIRNEDIVKNSDFVVVFWDGVSNGSKHSIDLAIKYNVPVRIVNY